jgi:hypothetical protein
MKKNWHTCSIRGHFLGTFTWKLAALFLAQSGPTMTPVSNLLQNYPVILQDPHPSRWERYCSKLWSLNKIIIDVINSMGK